MNLYDLLRRNDRSVTLVGCNATALDFKRTGGMVRCVRFDSPGELVIADAHMASALRTFPESLDWCINGSAGSSVVLLLRTPSGDFRLAEANCVPGKDVELRLRWPVPVPSKFDLVVRNEQAR
ncbi:MAG: hypothetical protein ACREDP_06130, partial [Bradyrhizobium sp.]